VGGARDKERRARRGINDWGRKIDEEKDETVLGGKGGSSAM